MRIAIITPLYWPSIGGVQTSVRLTAAHLARQGHEVTVLTSQMRHADEAGVRRFRRIEGLPVLETYQGIRIRRFPSGGPLDSFYGLLYAVSYRLRFPFWPWIYRRYRLRRFRSRCMLRFLREITPDLVVIKPCLDELIELGLQARRATGAKLAMITSLHISSDGFVPRGLRRLAEFDAVLTNTPAEKDLLSQQGVPAEKIHVTGAPVDLEEMRSIAPHTTDPALLAFGQKKYVLYLGRLDEGKGLETLVEIFEEPSSELRNVNLVLAGVPAGHFNKKIRSRIQGKPWIVTVDSPDEAAKWWLYKHASVYCMVSNVDSFGITYMEAWLSGLPVVAADLPAMRFVIKNGEDGLLARYGDTNDIRKTLLQLLNDPEAAKRMGEKGRQKVLTERGDFAVEKKVEKILTALPRMGGEKGDGRRKMGE